MNQPEKVTKYSIVIPTRNREEYLPYAIESVLSQFRDDVELIVSDNYSKDGTASYLATLTDPRLKVVKPPEELPMSSHYEFALSQATGDWVTIVGDDDAVMPYIFEKLDLIIKKYPDSSIISSKLAHYFWSGCEDLYGDSVVYYHTSPKVKLRWTKRDLMWALAGLRSCFNMPQVYASSIVKNSLIREIKKNSGGYFYHSIIPDMYSVVALSLTEDKYVRLDEPLFWSGTSMKSMARSDRIYRDAEIQLNNKKSNYDNDRVLKLNQNISQELHGAGFSSLYLYEALRQCPFAGSKWQGKFVSSIVYAGLKLTVVEKENKKELVNAIARDMNQNKISIILVALILCVLHVIKLCEKIQSFPQRLWSKLTGDLKKNSIKSNKRSDFPNIKVAADAVVKLKENT